MKLIICSVLFHMKFTITVEPFLTFFNLFLIYRICRRYIEAKADRVTVIFSTVFKDQDDVIIGKVFLQVCILGIDIWNSLLEMKLLTVHVIMLYTEFTAD